GLRQGDQAALADPVADLDADLLDGAGVRAGHLHGGLVALEGDERLFFRDGIAWLDQHFDDGDVLEVAGVRNLQLDEFCHSLSFCSNTETARGHGPGRPAAGGGRLDQTVAGFGLAGSIPYFLMASATLLAGSLPSSASALSAATVTK